MGTNDFKKTMDNQNKTSSVQVDALDMPQKIADLTEKYLKKYGCTSCWSDVHQCTCNHDKCVIKVFVDYLKFEFKKLDA